MLEWKIDIKVSMVKVISKSENKKKLKTITVR
jgi:hypothetical protein